MWYGWGVILGERPFGETLAQLRISSGLTMAQAAERMGTTPSLWGRLEKGTVPNPKYELMMRALKALDAVIEIKVKPRAASWHFDQ